MAKRKHQSAYRKATDALEQEGRKQCFIIYGASAIALWRHHGKRQQAITRLFDITSEVWQDCARTNQHSMIEMCERETGIEVQNGEGKSWHDLHFLNSQLDPGRMTGAQWVYMRQQQIKWVAPTILAGILLALHRKYKFGYRRCSQIYAQILDIENEFGMDPMKLKAACLAETEVEIHDRNKYRRKGGE